MIERESWSAEQKKERKKSVFFSSLSDKIIGLGERKRGNKKKRQKN